ncbi:hypothetical protein CCP3SC15_3140001 [Gammaproteobacteria bacterium]
MNLAVGFNPRLRVVYYDRRVVTIEFTSKIIMFIQSSLRDDENLPLQSWVEAHG